MRLSAQNGRLGFRLLIAAVALAGVAGVLPIVSEQVRGNSCPQIGDIPACVVVLAAYGLIAISTLLEAGPRTASFALGWVLLFGLAVIGTTLEIMGNDACPRTGFGIPTCFISLFMVLVLAGAFILGRGWRAVQLPS